ncbi:MAG: hypothetical protein AAGK37_14285 [Pseudomonadota bacterium]
MPARPPALADFIAFLVFGLLVRFDAQLSEASQDFRDALKNFRAGAIADTRAVVEQRWEYLLYLLDTRIEQAHVLADQRAANITPERRKMANTAVPRGEIDKAHTAAKHNCDDRLQL